MSDASGRLNEAFSERDRCVSLIARMALQLGLLSYKALDVTEEHGRQWVVFVELPEGQVSWRITDSELQWFATLPVRENRWDGHDVEEKYRRVMADWPWDPR